MRLELHAFSSQGSRTAANPTANAHRGGGGPGVGITTSQALGPLGNHTRATRAANGSVVEDIYGWDEDYTTGVALRRPRRPAKSKLQEEGDVLLKSFFKLTKHTSHGLCRAVNVSGSALSIVAGSAFKIAGAAVIDTAEGMRYASEISPINVPVLDEGYRLLARGLRKTGKAVYSIGQAAENVTVGATEAVEDSVRFLVDGVIETAEDTTYSLFNDDQGGDEEDYFGDIEARIAENFVFEMASPRSTL
ncbi:unnamed protein product, partial [Discosporangium mesarthrocarpum]